MPEDLKLLRSLLGWSVLRKFLADMIKRIRPITFLLKQGVKSVFTPATEAIVRQLLAKVAQPPVFVCPWYALTGTRSPKTPVLFSCTATQASTASEPPSNKEKKDTTIRLWFSSIATGLNRVKIPKQRYQITM